MDTGRRSRVELIDPEPDEFGHAQPGGERNMKHRPVVCARGCARVRSIQQCLDLVPGHTQARRNMVEHLADGLTDQMEAATAAETGLVIEIEPNILAF